MLVSQKNITVDWYKIKQVTQKIQYICTHFGVLLRLWIGEIQAPSNMYLEGSPGIGFYYVGLGHSTLLQLSLYTSVILVSVVPEKPLAPNLNCGLKISQVWFMQEWSFIWEKPSQKCSQVWYKSTTKILITM